MSVVEPYDIMYSTLHATARDSVYVLANVYALILVKKPSL